MVWQPERLKKRAEFVRTSNGVRWSQPTFVLQRSDEVDAVQNIPPRFGFTVTKKTGNSVVRSRIKRRLREAARHLDPSQLQYGYDYVLIGRNGTLRVDFAELCRDIQSAAQKLANGRGQRGPNKRRKKVSGTGSGNSRARQTN